MVKIKFPEMRGNPTARTDKRGSKEKKYSQERRNPTAITDSDPSVSNGIPFPARSTDYFSRSGMRVFEYRLADNPDAWLTLIAPGDDLREATTCLSRRFGQSLIEVRAMKGVTK